MPTKIHSAEDRIYTIAVRRLSNQEIFLRMMVYFGILTFWLGVSYSWFGGSWIINILVLIAALTIPAGMKKRIGDHANMTRDELREWLDAGCPDSWPSRKSQEP